MLQWLLVAAVVAGSGLVRGRLRCWCTCGSRPLPEVTWWGFPPPLVLIVGGVLAGLLVAALSRIGVEVGARRRTRAARRSLLRAIDQVTATHVVEPVQAELARYHAAQAALALARG